MIIGRNIMVQLVLLDELKHQALNGMVLNY